MSTDTLHSVPDLSFNLSRFSFQTNPLLSVQSNFHPVYPLLSPYFTLLYLLAIFLPGEYKRVKFVIQRMKLHLKVNNLGSFTSQSFNQICQEKIIADDYASVNWASAVITRTVWQVRLYDNYSETRTVINVFLLNFASGMANRARRKALLRSWVGEILLPKPPCQHCVWDETGVPGGNLRLSANRTRLKRITAVLWVKEIL